MKYRKKPVEIEAFQFGIDSIPDWFMNKVTKNEIILVSMGKHFPIEGCCIIPTLEGEMKGDIGDFIIKGIKGEIYPCKSDIFKKTYEEVTE